MKRETDRSGTSAAMRWHPRGYASFRYVYPVVSRRARGISIGINLNPERSCNFDCVYCQVERDVEPMVETLDLDALIVELDEILVAASSGDLAATPPFDAVEPPLRIARDVAIAGDGEPTIVRNFETIVDRVLSRKSLAGHARLPLRLLTNATRLERPGVGRAVDQIVASGGEIWAKLDAGTEAGYRRINRCAVPYSTVIRNIAGTACRVPIVIQSMLLRWRGTAPDDFEIDAYVDRLVEIQRGGGQIARVQIYTIARPASEPGAEPLELARLEAIAVRVRGATALEVEVFPAP